MASLFRKAAGDTVIKNSSDLATYLLEDSHVAVVPGVAFEAPDYLRLTYASSMENIIEGMDRIEASIRKLH